MFRVVSLADQGCRRAAAADRFHAAGVPFSFFDAIYTSDTEAALRSARVQRSAPLSSGEVGCALSHLAIHQEARAPFVKVLEDDAIPANFDEDFLAVILRKLQPGDVVILSNPSTKDKFLGGKVIRCSGGNFLRLDIFSIALLRGTAAYVATPEAATGMANAQRRKLRVADSWFTFWATGGIKRIYFCPMFFHPSVEKEKSVLEGNRAGKSIYMSLPVIVRSAVKGFARLSIGLIRRLRGHQRAYDVWPFLKKLHV